MFIIVLVLIETSKRNINEMLFYSWLVGLMPKKKRKFTAQAWMAMFIVLIMASSIIGFLWGGGQEDAFEYGGISFEEIDDYYYAEINGKKARFYNFPSEILFFNMSQEVIDAIAGNVMVYITFDPDNLSRTDLSYIDLFRFELRKEFMDYFSMYAVDAVSAENSTYLPLYVTCANATAAVPVINLVSSNQALAEVSGNCVTIKGKNIDFIIAKDRILYGLFGVI